MQHHEMAEMIIQEICSVCSLEQSYSGEYRKTICRDANKCKVLEKSERQLEYVLSPIAKNIFLKACPGSGKTEVVGLKAAYEFYGWKHRNSGIAVLTFTNNAADVIGKRVRQFSGLESATYPHFIGTFDSWLHRYIAHPFAYVVTGYKGRKVDGKYDKSIRLVEDGVSEGWLANYECSTGYCYLREGVATPHFMPLYANMLQYDIERDCWEIRNRASESNEYVTDWEYFDSEAFKLFRSDKPWLTLQYVRAGFEKIKNKFLGDGFGTYNDIEWVCYRFLKEKADFTDRLFHRFPFIIVDECQDLSQIQLEILGLLKDAGTKLHLVGDLQQAIYKFKKVDPRKVEAFVSNNDFDHQALADNFRSCQPIVSLCQKLIGGCQVNGKEAIPREPVCVCFVYNDKESMSSLPIRFEKYLKENLKIDVAKSAILVRGKSMVYKLKSLSVSEIHKPQIRLAMAIHLWSTQRLSFMDDALQYLGKFLASKYFAKDRSDARLYYCPESINSPMRWRLFLARILDICLQDDGGINNLNQTWGTWAECVRNRFSQIATLCLPVLANAIKRDLKSFEKLAGKDFRALSGSTNEHVTLKLAMQKEEPTNLQIVTIHSVKGKTFDAVLLISSPDRRGAKGGHWTEWLADPHNEHARFAYVASSRPKYFLTWAIPASERNEQNTERIQKLGFVFEDLPFIENREDKDEAAG
jgi:DNA helicase-2/ATP-dependent DNA helicase PcrA